MKVVIARMKDHEPWWAEFWSAVGAIAWCVASIGFSPGLERMPAFAFAVAMVPPWSVYVFGLLVPAAQLWAVRADQRHARVVLCAVMSWWWAMLFLGLAIWTDFTPGMVLYAVMSLANAVSVAVLHLPKFRIAG